jgi:hypothetical protein
MLHGGYRLGIADCLTINDQIHSVKSSQYFADTICIENKFAKIYDVPSFTCGKVVPFVLQTVHLKGCVFVYTIRGMIQDIDSICFDRLVAP